VIGIFITALGTFFCEVGIVIGKFQFRKKKESIYSMGYLYLFWATIFFLLAALIFPSTFVFSLESLPTFGARLMLEIAQFHVLVLAITRAHRSSFGFLRTITIPLMLIADIMLGYSIGTKHIIGMVIIFLTLLMLFLNHRIRKEGIGLVLFTSINAVFTISLYKYNITHFNSVVAEQLIVHLVLLLYFTILAKYIAKEHPFKLLRKRVFFLQSFLEGVGGVLLSFAYIFAPASIIMAGKRAFAIFWTIVSGNKVFHEHHIVIKMIAFAMLAVGIILLI